METDRWLPAKHALPDGSMLGRLLFDAADWQVYRIGREETVLIAHSVLGGKWTDLGLLPKSILRPFSHDGTDYLYLRSGKHLQLAPVDLGRPPETKADGLAFAVSLRETRKLLSSVPLHDSIYVERYSRLLPTWSVSEASDDKTVLGKWLTGGVGVSATSFRRLSSLLGWLDRSDVADLVEAAGFGANHEKPAPPSKAPASASPVGVGAGATTVGKVDTVPAGQGDQRPFNLPGRPALEAFFREHIIDIIENAGRYKALGVEFPGAVVLHGPPGCGKTYAVERLVEYLDWPIFHVDSNSVGSPYIHETSRKIAETFERAMDASPSLIIIDEMEAYLSDRQLHQSTGLHHVEEVAEFLRRIPEAAGHRVLVIGITNRLEMIDPAILRRGRFDHVIEVGMPSAKEVSLLIEALLAKVPISGELDTAEVIQSLTGRPLSDAAFVVREAARLAARAGKSSLDTVSLRAALSSLPPSEPEKPTIGFLAG